jgi:hypothetical protein
MAIEDVVAAAYRIQESAAGLRSRSTVSGDALRRHAQSLAVVTRGSRSGMEAVRQVEAAQRAVLESAVQLSKLERELTAFMADLAK